MSCPLHVYIILDQKINFVYNDEIKLKNNYRNIKIIPK